MPAHHNGTRERSRFWVSVLETKAFEDLLDVNLLVEVDALTPPIPSDPNTEIEL